ncbi:hypothetical protein ACR764_19050 [Clostridium botulinum]
MYNASSIHSKWKYKMAIIVIWKMKFRMHLQISSNKTEKVIFKLTDNYLEKIINMINKYLER